MIKIVYGVIIARNHNTQEIAAGKFMGDQRIYPRTLEKLVVGIKVVKDEAETQHQVGGPRLPSNSRFFKTAKARRYWSSKPYQGAT